MIIFLIKLLLVEKKEYKEKKMKKLFFVSIFSISLIMSGGLNDKTMASTLTPQPNNSAEVGTFVVINPGDGFTWKWYYTDYSLSDGRY